MFTVSADIKFDGALSVSELIGCTCTKEEKSIANCTGKVENKSSSLLRQMGDFSSIVKNIFLWVGLTSFGFRMFRFSNRPPFYTFALLQLLKKVIFDLLRSLTETSSHGIFERASTRLVFKNIFTSLEHLLSQILSGSEHERSYVSSQITKKSITSLIGSALKIIPSHLMLIVQLAIFPTQMHLVFVHNANDLSTALRF
ncbi:hypothetical protein TNCT_632871 [Trichonephila clavata]|uniref:Uncharacterized protein n=1 Tax=Trichonephila clavata TaxID=2740835 RepID=A0A8X6IW68_TRICU|nr:hypothetical protein TNCT_632871 [Trichonephila clavata]